MVSRKKYLTLNEITAYKKSFLLAQKIWDVVILWEPFAKQTIGLQLARSIDSISANIAEGFGRYNKKDKIRFYRIARGSLYESCDWIEKAHRRKLLSKKLYQEIFAVLQELPKDVNGLIKLYEHKTKRII